MLRLPQLTVALLAVAIGSASVVESRMILPVSLQLQANRQYFRGTHTTAAVSEELIDSYFRSSGFPTAGRSLHQKIEEAQAFLDVEVPKTGTVGTSVAIVYEDQVVLATGYGVHRWGDPSSPNVSRDSMFQIGSVSKTFIGIGVGLLVEDGKLQWHDPVKKHLPWLTLYDKYMEKHVTIGDLLSMNSGFWGQPDLRLFAGQRTTERAFVEALESIKPEFSLREMPAYSNTNFEILGQMIEHVSGQSWPRFLTERVWAPLGMNHTFASAATVPRELQMSSLTDGHMVCDGNVLGPFPLTSQMGALALGAEDGLISAGSIVSSPADMATFARFILNKGKVGDTTLFKDPSTIATMISGKNVAAAELLGAASYFDVEFAPEGDTLAAGYAFDYVGHAMWGHAYAMKGGLTAVQIADFSLAPRNGLGVMILANSPGTVDKLSLIRSHIMGIFLDVPKPVLDFQFQKTRENLRPRPSSKLLPRCGIQFWKDAPHVALSASDQDAFVGKYVANAAPTFFPTLTITRSLQVEHEYVVEMGAVNASYFSAGSEGETTYLKAASGSVSLMFSAFTAVRNASDGSFTLSIAGTAFQKRQQ